MSDAEECENASWCLRKSVDCERYEAALREIARIANGYEVGEPIPWTLSNVLFEIALAAETALGRE